MLLQARQTSYEAKEEKSLQQMARLRSPLDALVFSLGRLGQAVLLTKLAAVMQN